MARLGEVVRQVRSKNAGPFWLTVDIFCGSDAAFARVRDALKDEEVARLFRCAPARLRRFDIASLNAIKISLPRPVVQGSPGDRDLHGASYANLLAEMEIPDNS